jgi:pimeloyl-ACP methyl ester carboxylesterase
MHEQLVHVDDGTTLRVRVARPRSPARSTVVVAHGFTGACDQPAVVAQAAALVHDGHTVVTFDSRGHGASDGLCTLGEFEARDVRAVAAATRDLRLPLVLVGASMGGIAVLRHAATDTTVDGVVAVSTPATWRMPRSWRAVLAAGLTQTPMGRWSAKRWLGVRLARPGPRATAPNVLAAALRVPLAVVHGSSDRFIATRDAQKLVDAAGGPSRAWIVPDMGHAYDEAAVGPVVEAVSWVLANARSYA